MDKNRRDLLKQKLMAAAAIGLAGVAGNALAQAKPGTPNATSAPKKKIGTARGR